MSNTGVHVRNRHMSGTNGLAATRDTHGPPGFSPSVEGVSYADARDGEQSQTGDIAPGAVDGTVHIVEGSIAPVLFAESIRAPTVVDVLPTLPDTDYPSGALVFYTPDGKLYRNVADAWTVAVDGADIIADSITAGQIAVGAIGADEIAAGALRTEHLSIGMLRQDLLIGGDFDEPTRAHGDYQLASCFNGWTADGNILSAPSTSSNVKSGSYIAVIKSNTGSVANAGLGQFVPLRVGRTYRLSGWGWKGSSGGGNAQILCHAYDKDLNVVAFNAMVSVNHNTSTPTFGEDFYTCPAGVAFIRVLVRLSGTPTTSEVFAFDSVTLEEVPGGAANGSGEVIIDDTGISVTNGKITVMNGSAVVIIDGSSNMFKIVASGSLVRSLAASTAGFQQAESGVTLSGLGAQTTVPAFIAFAGPSTSVTDSRRGSTALIISAGNAFFSTASGGAATARGIGIFGRVQLYAKLNGSNQAQMWLEVDAHGLAALTQYGYYHVLKEAAL